MFPWQKKKDEITTGSFYTSDPEKRDLESLAEEYKWLTEKQKFLFLRRMSDELRERLGRRIFGEKLDGDVGWRSTQGHPKTDYGQPSFNGDFDDFNT